MKDRVNRFREKMASLGLTGFLVFNPHNRYYLSGFTGSSGILLVTATGAYMITDFRYLEQASAEAPGFQVRGPGPGSSWEELLGEILAADKVARVGLAREHVTVGQLDNLKAKVEGIEFVPVQDPVVKLRAKKDPAEIEALKNAARLADEAFGEIVKTLAPGQREDEVSLELEFHMRRQGAKKAAFDFIVASGKRSSMPHGVASNKVMEPGDFVTMDYGCQADWYNSDMTRTVVLGQADDKQKEIYRIVMEAQQAAAEAVAPGKRCSDLDKVARDIIAKAGYGEFFGHSLGHGVGLEVHEEPSLSTKDDTILEPGMVVTVEPGIYLPDWGGVRIEDMVLVTADGHEVLTYSPRELMEL